MNESLQALFERDKGICHICKGPIRDDVDPKHPEFPSKDHLIPVCRRPERASVFDSFESKYLEVSLAHSFCNSRRGDIPLHKLRPEKYKKMLWEATLDYEFSEQYPEGYSTG